MTTFIRRPETFTATLYTSGLEDYLDELHRPRLRNFDGTGDYLIQAGDYIVTDSTGRRFPVSAEEFAAGYHAVEE